MKASTYILTLQEKHMTRDELFKKFNQNVNYLQENIAPDDIYAFAEQLLMSNMFFLAEWSEVVDVNELAKNCPITKKYVGNILHVIRNRDEGKKLQLDLGLEEMT